MMTAVKATERRQPTRQEDSPSQASHMNDRHLDRRYGEIGISAVAGSVCHKGDARRSAPVKATINHFEHD
jgi:hypothetical protein